MGSVIDCDHGAYDHVDPIDRYVWSEFEDEAYFKVKRRVLSLLVTDKVFLGENLLPDTIRFIRTRNKTNSAMQVELKIGMGNNRSTRIVQTGISMDSDRLRDTVKLMLVEVHVKKSRSDANS